MTEYSQARDKLLAMREQLMTRLENIKSNVTRGRSADSQEQAQELENAEVVDALGNETRHELRLIARALDQIEQGTYGECADCGQRISEARLNAQPFADRCIGCATAAESGRR
jgi:DnaK suppressor protein